MQVFHGFKGDSSARRQQNSGVVARPKEKPGAWGRKQLTQCLKHWITCPLGQLRQGTACRILCPRGRFYADLVNACPL
eukprot:5128557-Amphidinium_carterae.1